MKRTFNFIKVYVTFSLICTTFLLSGQSKKVDTLVVPYQFGKIDRHHIDITPYLTILPDSQGTLSIQEVAEIFRLNRFDQSISNLKTEFVELFRGGAKAYWAHFTLYSQADKDLTFWLYLDAGVVQLYYASESDSLTQMVTGILIPQSDRIQTNSPIRFPVLPIFLPSQKVQTFYFRLTGPGINAGSRYSLKYDRKLISPESFQLFDRQFWFLNTLILGILVAVGVYHFLIYLYRRKNEYLFFSLFVLSFVWVFLVFNGYLSEFVITGLQNDYLIVHAAFAWTAVYLALYFFTRTFLNIKEHFIKLDKIWKALLLLRVILTMILVFIILNSGGLSNVTLPSFEKILLTGGILHYVLLILAIVAGIISIPIDAGKSSLFLIGMCAFIFQGLMNQLQYSEILSLPDWLKMDFGIIITVFLFAFGIARRLKILEEEKISAVKAGLLQEVEIKKMTELNQFKSRFFTNISHDFRTPLTIILGISDQMRQKPTEWTDKGLAMIKSNGKKLLRMINQILELAKLDEGVQPVRMIKGDIITYLKYLVESYRTLVEEKSIQLSFESQISHLTMHYDPEIIEHILSNLVSNAIKFTPENGAVLIQCSYSEEFYFRIKVSDTGPGIRQEIIQKIFDRFVKDDSKDANEYGFGIGLAITKELISLINGKIQVISSPEEGTTFLVDIPYNHEQIASKEQLPTKLIQRAEIKKVDNKTLQPENAIILLVEDNQDVLTYLESMLTAKYNVFTAHDGVQGLKNAISIIPDIIVSDVMMPEMDGTEMCLRLKSDIRTSHIPIILLTAKSDYDSKIKGLKKGADVYLSKPFDEKELFVQIGNLLKNRDKMKTHYQDIRSFFQVQNNSAQTGSEREHAFMQDLVNIVLKNIASPHFGVPELCYEIGMSRSQLYRKFSSISQYSIAEFIRKIKMHKALEFMTSSDMNITQISIEVGYRNLATFSKNFKEEFGKTPSEYL